MKNQSLWNISYDFNEFGLFVGLILRVSIRLRVPKDLKLLSEFVYCFRLILANVILSLGFVITTRKIKVSLFYDNYWNDSHTEYGLREMTFIFLFENIKRGKCWCRISTKLYLLF